MPGPNTRDYFAEMYVAALFGDDDWNVYFPRRDNGFDMLVTKTVGQRVVMRPIQVKGLYPTEIKTDKAVYGFSGRLSQVHPDMVLVLVFFDTNFKTSSPKHVAWMPREMVREKSRPEHFRCQPAVYKSGEASPRRDYMKYFDASGLALLSR